MSKKWKPNKRESLLSGDTCFSRTIFIFGSLWGNILSDFRLGFQLLLSFCFTTTHCHQFGGRTLIRHSHVNLLVDTTLQCHIMFHYYRVWCPDSSELINTGHPALYSTACWHHLHWNNLPSSLESISFFELDFFERFGKFFPEYQHRNGRGHLLLGHTLICGLLNLVAVFLGHLMTQGLKWRSCWSFLDGYIYHKS